jgi:hypothetical protein
VFSDLASAGVLALPTPMPAHAIPLGAKVDQCKAVPAPGIVQLWGG